MKTKVFDTVQMKRQGAEKLQARLEAMTPEQEAEFWRERTEALRKRQQALIAQRKAS